MSNAEMIAREAIEESRREGGKPTVLKFTDAVFKALEPYADSVDAMEGRCTSPDCDVAHEAYGFSGEGWSVILVMAPQPSEVTTFTCH